ncbi:putative RNA helicase [Heterostelium album PN500]|uniref:Putative RNA helicase n=1 Tax=Heterostelium pallidum (strain ATCC 26659 / Pp 5 / PN500) TaxID=670386 RepID=D3BEQ9_HETP5|nr:putative RNA helicase [Heterostelium album PN500]EFA80390.1 putative RNA helicase [Heterostelium album PN500]|eukprot:XP_020432510.1 putative RNA helicase [Heterostelium album PN500]
MAEFRHPKSLLGEMLATRGQALPVYNTVPVGSMFVCTVTFNGASFKSSPKLNKKEAEKEAAALGVSAFQDNIRGPTANREALPDGAENEKEEQANEKVEEQFNQQDLEALLGSLSLGNNVDGKLTVKSENKRFGGEFTFYNEHLKRMDTVSVEAKLYTKASVAIYLQNEMLIKLSGDQKAYSVGRFNPEAVTTPVQRNFKDADIPLTPHQPREYQKYFYKKAMEDNIICCIPTGLGKTQIAAMVICKMKQMNPKKRILFLVERIPLVLQQEKYIREQTGLNVLGVHGDMSIDAKLNDHHDVLVSISALFLNLLRDNKGVMEQYSLIVFDEAHHIVKDHSFSMLLKKHYKDMEDDVKPKVMGLTASPAGKSSWIDTFISLKVMSCISGCRIISPDAETQADIEEHRNTAELQLVELQQHPKEKYLINAINCITKHFASSLVPTKKEYQYEDIQELLVKLENTDNEYEQLLLNVANKCYDLVTYGNDPKDAAHPTVDYKQILINRFEATNIPKEKKQRLFEDLRAIPKEFDDDDTTNICKLDIALNILEEKNQTDPAFKAILFVKTRQSAEQLVKVLTTRAKEERYKFLKPGKVSGHGSTKSGGQSTASQKDIVEKFRSGQHNVIVATAVLEEGLDVPECNVVIRIDSPATVTAYTQSRGRLRSKKSEFYAILKDFESNIYANLMKQEFYIKEAIEYLSDENTGLPESYNQILINSVYPKFDFEELLSKCRVYFQLDTKFETKHVGGPPHQPEFICDLYLNNELKETCKGSSKKDAEDKVSRQALANGLIPMIIRDKDMKLKTINK